MKAKNALILFVIAVILCVLVFLSEKKTTAPVGTKTGEVGQESKNLSILSNAAKDSVQKIEIQFPDKPSTHSITLVRDGEQWRVNEQRRYEIDESKENQLKNNLKFPMTAEFQARNPENHSLFEVTETSALKVKLYDKNSKTLEYLLVGKNGPSWQTSYIRYPGKNEVYLIGENWRTLFSASSENDWRNKKIFRDITAEKISSIIIDDRTSTRTIRLAKLSAGQMPDWGNKEDRERNGNWWIVEPGLFPAQVSQVTNMTRTIANLKAADFAEVNESDTGLLNPSLIIHAGDGITTKSLTVGREISKQTSQYFAKSNDSNVIFKIYRPMAFMRSPDELMELKPTPTPIPSITAASDIGDKSMDVLASEGTTTSIQLNPIQPVPAQRKLKITPPAGEQ